jgi:hypothetical protein
VNTSVRISPIPRVSTVRVSVVSVTDLSAMVPASPVAAALRASSSLRAYLSRRSRIPWARAAGRVAMSSAIPSSRSRTHTFRAVAATACRGSNGTGCRRLARSRAAGRSRPGVSLRATSNTAASNNARASSSVIGSPASTITDAWAREISPSSNAACVAGNDPTRITAADRWRSTVRSGVRHIAPICAANDRSGMSRTSDGPGASSCARARSTAAASNAVSSASNAARRRRVLARASSSAVTSCSASP